jgi:HD-GYP domain-containing protein (c-di-GMP phosphodiesterase class II)
VSDLTERVPLEQLRDLVVLGEALPFRVLDTGRRLLLNQGQVLASERQLERLIERGAWAERVLVEALRKQQAGLAEDAAPVRVQRQLTLFDQWEALIWDLDELTRRLARARASGEEVSSLAERVLGLLDADADIALFGCVRQDDQRFALYSFRHGLHCAVVCTLAARLLTWDAPRVKSLACAALTMNVAMAELQAAMAEQREPPSARQLEQIRAHPQGSAALLQQCGVDDQEWLRAVLEHHEHSDGQGYPLGLTVVCEGAQLLRLVDIYMAKISPRALRLPMTANAASKQLFAQSGGTALGMAVIRTMGAYPPGSLVQLKSGEVAVVTRRPASGTAPVAATLSNRLGIPSDDTEARDTARPEFAISAALGEDARFARVLPERVYGLVPAAALRPVRAPA